MRIHIDMETRSPENLKVTGAYKYARHPKADILCMMYAFGDGEVQSWTLDSAPPYDLLEAARDPRHGFHAFNVGFERRLWNFVGVRYGWPELPIQKWYDTQADALAMGFPADLGRCCQALDVEHKKSAAGTKLINTLCIPIKGTADQFRSRKDFPGLFEQLYDYCRQDVRAERSVSQALTVHTTSQGQERRIWAMTERVNDNGVPVDTVLARSFQSLVTVELADRAIETLIDLTDGRVTKGTQTKRMNAELETPLAAFDADHIKEALSCPLLSDRDRAIMESRKVFSNTSTAKFGRMADAAWDDGIVRDILQYHGAATGRYAGRGIQIQNFPRSAHKDADNVAKFVNDPSNYLEIVEAEYGPVQDLAKTMLRPTICAKQDDIMVCRDYSSIEARGTAWATLDDAQIQAFFEGKDIYKTTASDMYSTPYEAINDTQRQAGKIAVLACGYQGGWKALRDFAVGYGVFWTPKEAWHIVNDFRNARPNLVSTWYAFDETATYAMRNPGVEFPVPNCQPCHFKMVGQHLSMKLPNGKLLWFPYAEIRKVTIKYQTPEGEWKKMVKDGITHMWINSKNQWVRRSIHGGSLFQSYIQAICRELICEAMLRLEDHAWQINMQVHDEVTSIMPREWVTPERIEEFERLLVHVPDWAVGFPIGANGWEGRRFRK